TPGMLEPKYALQANMMTFVKEALKDADILILIIDIADKNMEFFGFDKALTETETPMLIALNKVDVTDQSGVEIAVERLKQTFPNAEIMPVSALHNFGIEHLKNRVHALLPESPPYYEK